MTKPFRSFLLDESFVLVSIEKGPEQLECDEELRKIIAGIFYAFDDDSYLHASFLADTFSSPFYDHTILT